MSGILKLFNILVADSDDHLGKVFHKTLEHMGFSNVHLAGNGEKALETLQKKPFDLLITEWNLQKLDGMELINSVRRNPNSSDPTLPIIMLTGRAEESDVVAARDAGVNEYVIKPFSAKTIYTRLERLIENPKNFVVSANYVGPDRRNKGNTSSADMADKRKSIVTPQLKPKTAANEIVRVEAPKLWVVDYGLTRKLGKGNALRDLITPEAINAAQTAIDAISVESLKWIRENLQDLKQVYQNLAKTTDDAPFVSRLGDVALRLSGRAGTFGYSNPAKIAYLLYLFCNNCAHVDKQVALLIMEKHIHVLQVTLSPARSPLTAPETTLVIHELEQVAQKFMARRE